MLSLHLMINVLSLILQL